MEEFIEKLLTLLRDHPPEGVLDVSRIEGENAIGVELEDGGSLFLNVEEA